MNKKGLTTLELIVSFSLTMVVMIFLFQIVIVLKNLYVDYGIKSQLITKQALIENRIGEHFRLKRIYRINKCGENCININYTDTTAFTLKVDLENNIVTYDDYSVKLTDGAYFGDINVSVDNLSSSDSTAYDSFLKIEIPIYHKLFEGNYGINLLYQYKAAEAEIDKFTF